MKRTQQPHGSISAYRMHYHRGEEPCDECKAGNLEYKRKLAALRRSLGVPGAIAKRRRAANGQRVHRDVWWWECDREHEPGVVTCGSARTQEQAYDDLDEHNGSVWHPDDPIRRRRFRAAPGQHVIRPTRKGDTWWSWDCEHAHEPGTTTYERASTQDQAYTALEEHNAAHHPHLTEEARRG